MNNRAWKRVLGFVAGSLAFIASAGAAVTVLLNVSHDPTRELYVESNKAFTAYWKKKTGQDVQVRCSPDPNERFETWIARGLSTAGYLDAFGFLVAIDCEPPEAES